MKMLKLRSIKQYKMKKIKYKFMFECLVLLVTLIGCTGGMNDHFRVSRETYYVSIKGDDHARGSKRHPWRSIEKVNATAFKAGDAVYFEGGCTFDGMIRLDSMDSGMDGMDFVLGSYGEGKAVINGGIMQGMMAVNCDFFQVKDLVFIGAGRKNGNTTDGIYFTGAHNLIVNNLEISGFQHSGLHVQNSSNVKIEKIYAHDNGFAGIHITGINMNDPTKYENENIYIGHCVAEDNPGDPSVTNNHSGNGILASSVRGGIIEYCEAFNNGWDMPWTGNGPVGIWIWDCTDVIIQYCISHDNKTNPVAADGGGFDLDGGVSNSTIQYCLSFNNQGAGIGLFEFGAAKPWQNNVIRYNISQNDGINNGGSIAIWRNETGGTMRNCEIYNNTFFNNTARGVSLWIYNNWPGFNFRNNIFIYKGSFLFPGQKLNTELFLGNCYWNLSDDQSIAGYMNLEQWARKTGNEMLKGYIAGVYCDPYLVNPEALTITDPDRINKETQAGFSLKPGSPLIDHGLDLKKLFNLDVVKKDMIGTSLPQGNGFDIGALEFQGN
jgi:hypothetical protein